MIRRMIGAARLKSEIYEEVEADKSATRQAMLVVVIVALATGIGNLGSGDFVGLLGWYLGGTGRLGGLGLDHLLYRHHHFPDSAN